MILFESAVGLPGLWDGICAAGTSNCSITNASDILVLVANAIRIAMALAGGLGLIMIVLGGIYYVMSAGNPANIKRARDIMTNAVIGVVIASLGYTIVSFIAGRF